MAQPSSPRVLGALFPLLLAGALSFPFGALDGPELLRRRTEAEQRIYFIYALALVTEWPEEAFPGPKSPFTVGVLGPNDPGAGWESLEGRTVKGHPIQVLRSRTLEPLAGCHLIFLTSAASEDLPYVLRALRGRPVLTIGEQENITQLGGMVRCNPQEGMLPSEVNVRAAREGRLNFRAKFLSMVNRVSY